MSCKITRFDICRLIQESFVSPTFDFGDVDISNDTFVYTVKKYLTEKKQIIDVVKLDNNKIAIAEHDLKIGKYEHELLWIHGTNKDVVIQGIVEVTDKGNCKGSCNNQSNIIQVVTENTIVNVTYSENIINVGGGGNWGQIQGDIQNQTDLVALIDEKVGEVEVDLSNYDTKLEVDTKINDVKNWVENQDFVTSSELPSVGNGTITITQGGVSKGTFTTNQSGNATINLDAGSGDLSNYYTKTETETAITDVTGYLSNLITVEKNNIVDAVNEIAITASPRKWSTEVATQNWYRIGEVVSGSNGTSVIVLIERMFGNTNNESYAFVITSAYGHKVQIVQLSGTTNNQLISEIRVVSSLTTPSYIDIKYNGTLSNGVKTQVIGNGKALFATIAPASPANATVLSIKQGINTNSNINALGLALNNKSNNDVVLAGGGTKLLSDFVIKTANGDIELPAGKGLILRDDNGVRWKLKPSITGESIWELAT